MKHVNEKERNERIDKLVDLLSRKGVRQGNMSLEDCLSDENWFNRDQTEDDYQNEQKKWLENVAQKKRHKK